MTSEPLICERCGANSHGSDMAEEGLCQKCTNEFIEDCGKEEQHGPQRDHRQHQGQPQKP